MWFQLINPRRLTVLRVSTGGGLTAGSLRSSAHKLARLRTVLPGMLKTLPTCATLFTDTSKANEVEDGFAGSAFDIGYMLDSFSTHVQDTKVAEKRKEACQAPPSAGATPTFPGIPNPGLTLKPELNREGR